MGLEVNNDATTRAPQTEAPAPSASAGSSFGSNGAVPGSLDFLSLSSRLGISRIDSTVEPYIEKIMALVKANLNNVALVRLTKSNNAYAVKYDGPDGVLNFFGIQFVSMSDPVSQNLFPASIRLPQLYDELKETYADKSIRLVDARIILAGYEPDMARADIMADTIVRMFQVSSNPEAKNAQISVLTSNEFVADWRLQEAKITENSLSPHGIRPRMDVGLTIKAKIKNDLGGREFREFNEDFVTLGVIGGYTEIGEKEAVRVNDRIEMRYRPVFHITVLNSVIPLEGVASILMAALAPTILSTVFWARQWNDLSEGSPNPGMLEENPERRGSPIVLKDQEELLDFIRAYFSEPLISFQFQDGRDQIPGIWRLGSADPSARSTLISRLSNFFNSDPDTVQNFELSRIIEERYEGAYGDRNGTLLDSRDIDYLKIAATNGYGSIDKNMRHVLLRGTGNPTDRARLAQTATNSLYPLWRTWIVIINNDFFKWVVQRTDRSHLRIVDPNGQAESRPIGSLVDGFGSASGIGSIVSNGIQSRSLNIDSFRSW